MSKNLTGKYYQENEKRIQKELEKDIEEKEKSDNMAMNITKISQKMKNKSLISIEKKYYRMRKKCLIVIIREYLI